MTTAPAPTAIATQTAPRALTEFDPSDPVSLYMNTAVFDQLQRVGKMLAQSTFIPEHLRGKIGDCAVIAAQAFRWRMDPLAVAQHTFVLKGHLGYEGKLVAAVVNTGANMQRRLDYAYSGTKGTKDRSVIVSGWLRGEDAPRTIDGTVGAWATDNEKWRLDPDQMLAYRGARQWARRHAPEVLLGVQAEDEIRETVALERADDGSFAVRTLDDVATRLEAATIEPCPHTEARKVALEPGEMTPCRVCGEELRAPTPPTTPTRGAAFTPPQAGEPVRGVEAAPGFVAPVVAGPCTHNFAREMAEKSGREVVCACGAELHPQPPALGVEAVIERPASPPASREPGDDEPFGEPPPLSGTPPPLRGRGKGRAPLED